MSPPTINVRDENSMESSWPKKYLCIPIHISNPSSGHHTPCIDEILGPPRTFVGTTTYGCGQGAWFC